MEPEQFRMFGTTFQGSRVVQSPLSDNAKRHIFRSSILLGITPLIVLPVFLWNKLAALDSLALSVLAAYVAWASYWGGVGIADLLADHGERRAARAALHVAVHHLGIYGLVGLPLTLGIVYGTLGGGAYEFVKSRRIVRNLGLPSL